LKTVLAPDTSIRLDQYIADTIPELTRNQLKHRISLCKINGIDSKLSKHLKDGDIIEIEFTDPIATEILPENIPLDIIYEDKDIIVINKTQGMVVHPAVGNYSGTLVQGLLNHCSSLADEFREEPLRPGIVHRLDKDTSGVIVAAKTLSQREYLSAQFKDRNVTKTYLSIAKGRPDNDQGTINSLITREKYQRKRFTWSDTQGKEAITIYKVLRSIGAYSFVQLKPKTGRTHQLRVHMKMLGCPILGDPVYARKDALYPESTMMLHAYKIAFVLSNGKNVQFRAPLPPRFKRFLAPVKGSEIH
jgi:23S rRNA pseudouridine1911/1915/1917 synthase